MPKTDKNSFVLYKNYYEILNGLPDADMGILFKAILSYQALGEMPDLPMHLNFIFKFLKNQFDLDDEKYNEFLEKQSANGKKGGRPKIVKEPDEEIKENPKNPTLFFKTQKSLNDNVNDNDNENENDNVNVNVNDNLSLLNEREEIFSMRETSSKTESDNKITKEDEEILENYVRKNKLAKKNVKAYIRKIIANGDHEKIIKYEKSKLITRGKSPPEERIKSELESICDKKSALKVLAQYYNRLEAFPPELEKIAEQYDLDSSYKIDKYVQELYLQKEKQSA